MKINHNRDNVSSSPQREKVPVAAATKPKIFFFLSTESQRSWAHKSKWLFCTVLEGQREWESDVFIFLSFGCLCKQHKCIYLCLLLYWQAQQTANESFSHRTTALFIAYSLLQWTRNIRAILKMDWHWFWRALADMEVDLQQRSGSMI